MGATTLPDTIGKRIIAAREARRWSQGDLAAYANIPQGTICRYEQGYRRGIYPEMLIKIADATGVSTDYLLGRTDDPDAYPDTKMSRSRRARPRR